MEENNLSIVMYDLIPLLCNWSSFSILWSSLGRNFHEKFISSFEKCCLFLSHPWTGDIAIHYNELNEQNKQQHSIPSWKFSKSAYTEFFVHFKNLFRHNSSKIIKDFPLLIYQWTVSTYWTWGRPNKLFVHIQKPCNYTLKFTWTMNNCYR